MQPGSMLWQSGEIRRNMKKDFRRSRDFTLSEAAAFLAEALATAYKNWASFPKPRMI